MGIFGSILFFLGIGLAIFIVIKNWNWFKDLPK